MVTGFDVSSASLCMLLKEMNFSRQKRDEQLWRVYRNDVTLYEPHMLVFIDETGFDCRNSLRRYGYSFRGKTPQSCHLLVRGEQISVIGIMTVKGILDLKIVRCTANGDVFLEFVEENLLPCLMPFNGSNPNSIVILDNCTIHHVAPVTDLLWCISYHPTLQIITPLNGVSPK